MIDKKRKIEVYVLYNFAISSYLLFLGLSQSTLVHMTGHTYNSKVTVRCYACRAPYGYNVEILINSRSEDSLTLNYETGKCTHQLGECHPEVCSCSPSGNEFFRSFDLKDVTRTANFSCDMIFVDKTTLTTSRFSKYATIFYDGKGKRNVSKIYNYFVHYLINCVTCADSTKHVLSTLMGSYIIHVVYI